jgi:hypothetical protein
MHRAEWRLLPGKAVERLSVHYQLDCDYGTPLIALFRESDGNEPVYLCETHVAEVERLGRKCAKDRHTEAQPAEPPDRIKREDRTRGAEVATATGNATPSTITSPSGSAPSAMASAIAPKPGRAAKDPLARGRARDLTYGDSAKALVDEAIWNLQPGDYDVYSSALQSGKSAMEAAQAAGGQLAIMHRKVGDYTRALEALLAESKSIINPIEVINRPLEHATLELIGKDEINEAKKDAAIEQLGAFQESLNRGLNEEITPLRAFRMACSLGEGANWGATSELSHELKPAYGAVYTNLRDAMTAAVPGALGLFERLANLHVAKAELETAHQPNLLHNSETVSTTA